MKESNTGQSNYFAMKKIRTTALMVLSAIVMVAFVGCTKDNENSGGGNNGGDSSYQTKIVGKWQPTKCVDCSYDATTGELFEEKIYTSASHSGMPDDMFSVMQFNSDGTAYMSYSWIPKSNTAWTLYYAIDGSVLSYCFDYYDYYTEKWSIIKLTNSTMVWEQEGESDGRVRWTVRWEFEKVN